MYLGGLFMSFSSWPCSNCGPWGRRTASSPSWDSLPPNRQAVRRHELRSYEPMRPRTWERKQGKRGVRDHNLVTNTPSDKVGKKLSFTWRCWVYRHCSSFPFLVSAPCPTWRYQEQWHRSAQSLAGWCWSVCPAKKQEKQRQIQMQPYFYSNTSLTHTHKHTPWSCWYVRACFLDPRWCWSRRGWYYLQPSLHHPDLTKPALCTWRTTKRTDSWNH